MSASTALARSLHRSRGLTCLPRPCRGHLEARAALAGAAALAILTAAACRADPIDVPLAQLVRRGRAYEGREVATEGTVRAFTEAAGTYYVLEDADSNRVQLRPEEAARDYVSRAVRVIGRYGFDERRGRFLRAARVTALGGRTPDPSRPRR